MIRAEIKKTLIEAMRDNFGGISVPDFAVEVPENPEHGDYATNAAFLLSKTLKKNPREIAEILVKDYL